MLFVVDYEIIDDITFLNLFLHPILYFSKLIMKLNIEMHEFPAILNFRNGMHKQVHWSIQLQDYTMQLSIIQCGVFQGLNYVISQYDQRPCWQNIMEVESNPSAGYQNGEGQYNALEIINPLFHFSNV